MKNAIFNAFYIVDPVHLDFYHDGLLPLIMPDYIFEAMQSCEKAQERDSESLMKLGRIDPLS